jgi:hypothetical protein
MSTVKKVLEFELDGQPVYVEAELSDEGQLVSQTEGDEPVQADSRFTDAVTRIRPAAEFVLNAFREMNTPDEIKLEFGLNFAAKAGVVFASTNSTATFKVSLTYKNTKTPVKNNT